MYVEDYLNYYVTNIYFEMFYPPYIVFKLLLYTVHMKYSTYQYVSELTMYLLLLTEQDQVLFDLSTYRNEWHEVEVEPLDVKVSNAPPVFCPTYLQPDLPPNIPWKGRFSMHFLFLFLSNTWKNGEL